MADNTLGALVLGGFGFAVLVLVISSLREAAAMKRWPVAKGRVLSSKVEQYRSDAGSGHFRGARARMTLYRAVVTYEYEVDDRRLQERVLQADDGPVVPDHVGLAAGGRLSDILTKPPGKPHLSAYFIFISNTFSWFS